MAKVKIVLHGYLKDLYPHDISISGETPAEVINGLCKQTKAFDPALNEERHQVRVHGFDTKESLYLPFPPDLQELHIMPDLRGGKGGGGFLKIVIGAVLIATAIFNPFGIAAVSLGVSGATIGSVMFGIGASLVLGGLLEILSPAPQLDTLPDGLDPEASKYLGGDKNTVKIGTRIPLLYGEHMAYGHYLSFNVNPTHIVTG